MFITYVFYYIGAHLYKLLCITYRILCNFENISFKSMKCLKSKEFIIIFKNCKVIFVIYIDFVYIHIFFHANN